MSISKETRSKIISQYWGQFVMRLPDNDDKLKVIDWFKFDNAYLELKPISEITDEDAMGLVPEDKIRSNGKICWTNGICYYFAKDESIREHHVRSVEVLVLNSTRPETLSARNLQYLQSKGYALPYIDYSVDDLVKLGVYKLCQSQKSEKSESECFW